MRRPAGGRGGVCGAARHGWPPRRSPGTRAVAGSPLAGRWAAYPGVGGEDSPGNHVSPRCQDARIERKVTTCLFSRSPTIQKYRFATLHNFGCTFRCGVCSYKLRSGADGMPGQSWPRPEVPQRRRMKEALRSVAVDNVFFMGGEPTLARELPEMLRFAKQTLGVGPPRPHQRQPASAGRS